MTETYNKFGWPVPTNYELWIPTVNWLHRYVGTIGEDWEFYSGKIWFLKERDALMYLLRWL